MSTLVRVGQMPQVLRQEAQYFDGLSPAAHPAKVEMDEAGARLAVSTDDTDFSWPLDIIRAVPDQAGEDILVLRRADDPLKRLVLPNRNLLPSLHNAYKSAPVTKRGQLFGWAVAALASVALIIFVLVPILADQLAEFIPPEGEKALGDATLEQIRDALSGNDILPVKVCEAPNGLTALAKMQQRLEDHVDLSVPLTVTVLDHEMVNAFALPGGHIVLFRGLIEKAGTPEEVASVFAHEIGHVVSRDPTRHALRSAGSIGVLGLLFGDFAGGTMVLFLANRLIDAQYSQDAEAAADAFAHDVMLKAGLSPDALAVMFERFAEMGGETEGLVQHFMAHPALGDRIEAAREATPSDLAPEPMMSDFDWLALRNICSRS